MVKRVNPLLSYVVGAAFGALLFSSYSTGDDLGVAVNAGFGALILALVVYGEMKAGAFSDVGY